MDEKQIRKIVQDEMKKRTSGVPYIDRHIHDGNDSPKINQKDVIPLITGNGTITMSQSTTYLLKLGNVGITPRSISFIGGALNTTASPALHAMIVGSASLGVNQQFQPESSTSVILGPVVTSIIQGSAAIIVSNAGTSIIKNSQGHIVFAADASNNNYATASIISYTKSTITVQVTLAANWSISGLWTVS